MTFSKEKICSLLNSQEIDSCMAILRYFGLSGNSGNYRRLNNFAKCHGIDLAPIKKRGRSSGKGGIRPTPDSKIFKKGSTYPHSSLCSRLVKLGWEYKCSNPSCGVSDWIGKPIRLHVDHINGDGSDNRLENLRFLCPNCHQQTETWGNRKTPPKRFCEVCGTPTNNPKYCSHKCYPRKGIERHSTRKTTRPPKEILLTELQLSNWSAVGRKYGVSCNAVRKWVRFYGLDPKSIKTKRPPGGKKLEVPLDL